MDCSVQTLRALAALNVLVAAIQTGFGRFLNLGLSGEGWTQTHIGIALSVGTIVALICQVPGGALVEPSIRSGLCSWLLWLSRRSPRFSSGLMYACCQW